MQISRPVGIWDLGFGLSYSRAFPLSALLFFWTLSIFNLDRYPWVHEDEAWILSPGYKLFTQGIYGSDLFTGFFHIERIYLEFMPLMAWLQGAATRLFGVGVFQMRFLPVALGLLTLALTWSLAKRLGGALAAALALFLLLFWQWTPAGQAFFGSGVSLVDLARIARYDILVAPLGLAAFWCIVRAADSHALRLAFAAGILTGLATLAHVYGIFWAAAILLLLFTECGAMSRTIRLSRHRIVAFLTYLCGCVVALIPWLLVIVTNASDYIGQNFQYRDRFDLTSLSFYALNLLTEPARYHLGLHDPQTFLRAGFWLLIVGVPAVLLVLARRARRPVGERARRLLIPVLVLPLLFAILISNKQYNYIAPFVPLFAMAVASGLALSLNAPNMRMRGLALVLLALVGVQGALGLAQMQQTAHAAISPEVVFTSLRAAVPPDARVLGKPQYWLAFPAHDYRSIVSLSQLSDPHITPAPILWSAAFAQIAPRIVLLDADLDSMFADQGTTLSRERASAFAAYMESHQARLVQTVPDGRGGLLRIFELAP